MEKITPAQTTMTMRPPFQRVWYLSEKAPPASVPTTPPKPRSAAGHGGGSAEAHVGVALVIDGQPGGDARDREEDRPHADEHVAHGSDAEDHSQRRPQLGEGKRRGSVRTRGPRSRSSGSSAWEGVTRPPPRSSSPAARPRRDRGSRSRNTASATSRPGKPTMTNAHLQPERFADRTAQRPGRCRDRRTARPVGRRTPCPAFAGVAVAEVRRRRRVVDCLPDAHDGTRGKKVDVVDRGRGEQDEEAPAHEGPTDEPGAPDAIRDVAGRNRRNDAHEDEHRREQPELDVAEVPLVLQDRQHRLGRLRCPWRRRGRPRP